MSLRTPLGKVLGYGSANHGTDHWWMQRLTAVGLVLVGSWFLYSLFRLGDYSHAALSHWMAADAFNGVMLLLLAVTLSYHSALGVQVVIEDYVHKPSLKVVSLIANRFAHIFLGVAAVNAILRVIWRVAG